MRQAAALVEAAAAVDVRWGCSASHTTGTQEGEDEGMATATRVGAL